MLYICNFHVGIEKYHTSWDTILLTIFGTFLCSFTVFWKKIVVAIVAFFHSNDMVENFIIDIMAWNSSAKEMQSDCQKFQNLLGKE